MKHLLAYIIFYCVSTTYTAANSAQNDNIYRIPLVRRKSPLQMILKDPQYAKKLNIQKTHPTNENVTIFKYMDSEYYAEIQIGRPGKKFNVIFDTTWADMWIPSILCSKVVYPICATKNLYDGNASSTHKSIDPQPFNVAGLVGNLTCDTVTLGHLNVTDLVFAEIREIPNVPDYQMMHADGIIGLAYNSIARTTNPFFYKLLADKKILKPIFSVYLNRDPTTPKGGIIFLGGKEPKHMKDEMTYIPVTKKEYWQIEMDQFSVQINQTYMKHFCYPTCQVILDTSTNTIGVPKGDVDTINTLIGATEYLYNRYSVSCSKVKKLPTITLKFGNRDFHIGGRHYILKMDTGSNGTICLTAFTASELSNGLWSIGGAFMSSVYTTFDLEKNRVGIADLA